MQFRQHEGQRHWTLQRQLQCEEVAERSLRALTRNLIPGLQRGN
jgi:hypothetical protein